MTDYKTDEEKVEELKAWWQENGNSVIAGIALAIAGLFGWEYWKNNQITTASEASSLYAQVEQNAGTSLDNAQANIQTLQNDYSSTPYAAIASMKLAQDNASKGEYPAAAEALQWVIDNSSDEGFQQVAQLRLARVLLAMEKPAEALQLANKEYPAAYQSLQEELKGDVYVAQNKTAEARSAYDRAILSSTGGSTEFIKMKRDNLGEGA